MFITIAIKFLVEPSKLLVDLNSVRKRKQSVQVCF